MKNKSRSFVIPLDVYDFDIFISLGQTDVQFLKSFQKITTKEDYTDMCEKPEVYEMKNGAQGRTIRLSSGSIAIRTKDYPTSPTHYGYLQHEVFHAVAYLMDLIGMKLKIGISDEAYAYLIQRVTTEVYKFM